MLKLLPPSMLQAIDLLPSSNTPVSLFTRHSLREMVSGQGLAGYDLQLTPQGRDLALTWGEYLTENSGRVIQQCISSPIQRCVDTAALMIEGAVGSALDLSASSTEIVEQGLLVEPGSFVVDIQQAAPFFREQGALGFINSFINQRLPGMKHPVSGVRDVLELLFQSQAKQAGALSLAVSHDTILAAMLAVIAGRDQIQAQDWPDMMEGMFVWFEGEQFSQSQLKWIWRGQIGVLDMAAFEAKQGVS